MSIKNITRRERSFLIRIRLSILKLKASHIIVAYSSSPKKHCTKPMITDVQQKIAIPSKYSFYVGPNTTTLYRKLASQNGITVPLNKHISGNIKSIMVKILTANTFNCKQKFQILQALMIKKQNHPAYIKYSFSLANGVLNVLIIN